MPATMISIREVVTAASTQRTAVQHGDGVIRQEAFTKCKPPAHLNDDGLRL